MLRKFVTFIAGLFLLLLAIFLLLPILFPLQEYREDILEIVSEKTGRNVTIGGDLTLSLLPSVAIELNEVTIDNPEGFVSSHFAKIGTLQLNMALWPLLDKRVIVDALSIQEAEVFLEETVGGKKNWEFTTTKITKTAAGDAPKEKKTSSLQTNINQLVIENSKLHYLKPGQKISSEKLNLNYTPAQADLEVMLKHAGTGYHLTLNTPNAQSLFEEKNTPLKMRLSSPLIKGNFEGQLAGVNLSAGKADAMLEGVLDASLYTIGKLQSREFKATKEQAMLGLLSIDSSKDISATGEMVVNYAKRKPYINATLTLPKIDVDALTANKQAMLGLISSAYAAQPWSSEPINLSALNAVDVDAKLSVNSLTASGYPFEDVEALLNLKSGLLKLNQFDAKLHGGTVSAKGEISATNRWSITSQLTQIPFRKLTEKMMDKVAVTGMTDANLSLSSSGKSLQAWMQQLSGGGNLTIGQGKIEGYSLPKLFRKVIGLATPQTAQSNIAEQTNFSQIRTAFSIDKGVMRLREGGLEGDRLRAGAGGTVSLAQQSLNLTLTPELIPQIEVTEANQQVAGLMVPVNVTGSFDNISVRPDYSKTLGNLLKDPKNLENTLKNFKQEGKAIEDSFEPAKDTIKQNIKDFEDTKDPKKILNIINELDKKGVNPLGGLLGGSN
jgi:AsmA protein